MAHSDRVALSSIKTLTLYADQPTKARRTAPVPQLECTGKVCRNYQPSAIQCTNTGGTDIDIDWKCEADLPSSLRFGRLHVSCEGWDRPGDPFVLKGSCGLTYSLVRTPQSSSGSSYPFLFGIALILLAIFLYINRQFLRFLNPFTSAPSAPGSGGRGGGPTSSDPSARFGYGTSGTGFAPPPPPYTKYPSPNQSEPPSNQRWTPGFWSGLGAGGLAASTYHYLANRDRPYNPTYTTPGPRTEWDWERPVFTRTSGATQPEQSARRRAFGFNNDDGGAGSSTGPGTHLGETRRATGFGGSSVR